MKRNLAIAVGVLFVATLISIAILLWQVVESPLIVLAIVLLIAVFGSGAGLLIETNTRPWASNTTDELLRPPLLSHEGRRVAAGTVHDRSLTQRISDMVEADAAQRPISDRTPPWAIDVARDETPKEEL